MLVFLAYRIGIHNSHYIAHCEQHCIYGYCDEPGICTCINGYHGSACDQGLILMLIWKKPNIQLIHRVIMVVAYCKLPCVYGNCSAPEKCTCNNGYFGTTCAKGFCSCFLFSISLLTCVIFSPKAYMLKPENLKSTLQFWANSSQIF